MTESPNYRSDFLRTRVLVVDDEADAVANLVDILELDGHTVETAGSIAEVLARSDLGEMAAILLDRKLSDGNAEDLLPKLRHLAPEAAVLIVTGHWDLQGAIAALRQGAADYILKPINPEALRASLLRVADRLRLTKAKIRSEAAFRTLVENAPCLIILLRADHSVVYFNRFAEDVTGHLSTEVMGQDYFKIFIPEESHPGILEQFRRVLKGEVVRGLEHPFLCQDGTRRTVLWNAARLDDHEGAPAVLAIGQDITALKISQEQTLQSERLAAIGQMVTGLAHESGNALARSQACLEMLALEVQDRPEALELLHRIESAQNHLQQLYDEVRNYAAPLKLERERWPLDAVWRQAWTNLAVRRQGRHAQLSEECRGISLQCWIDPFRMEQVFRNMFENSLAACKDPVEIEVICREELSKGIPTIHVIVRDNGPGLTPEVRRRLFDPFFTTKTKGTGLGMAIAKRIVEAHEGKIHANSDLLVVQPVQPNKEGSQSFNRRGTEIHLLIPRELS